MWPFSKINKKPDIFDEIFNNCDYIFAKKQLFEHLAGGVYPQEFVSLLDNYYKDPSRKTAIDLIRYNPNLIIAFKDNRDKMKCMILYFYFN